MRFTISATSGSAASFWRRFSFWLPTRSRNLRPHNPPRPDRAAGTSAAKGLNPKVQSAIRDSSVAAIAAPVSPVLTIANAQYASAGVALRNRTSGAIQISGIVGPVKRAYLYWAFLYRSTTPPATQSIGFCRTTGVTPTACSSKTGTLLATGADTCWGSSGVAVYRADVTSSVPGNGIFLVSLGGGASASNSGADPWTSVTFPAAEGASLVVVGTGTKTVSVYDRGLSGATFFGSTSYTLNVPGGVKKTPVLWDNIGADGQTGSGRLTRLRRRQGKDLYQRCPDRRPGRGHHRQWRDGQRLGRRRRLASAAALGRHRPQPAHRRRECRRLGARRAVQLRGRVLRLRDADRQCDLVLNVNGR